MSVLVKICGITNFEDAINSVESGADMLGFVFYKGSKRYIEPEKSAEIIREVSSFALCVGVFVNNDVEEIKRIIDQTMIDVVQLSGDESPDVCEKLKSYVKVVKSFKVGDNFSEKILQNYDVDYVHFDTFIDGEFGGTGKTFNWDKIVGLSEKYKVILSGGLNSENVKDAILKVKPYAVDVSSGVEDFPGKKNFEKIKKFIENAKSVMI
ncbi:phosphoribosylanthranilate isomerase [Candidatus Chrysopegis kryptomonas]|uniref:N-(5'-phosphoribosyl)anthranilate isomerase n=1 Tax=Candidatus Chryseopegocella kryptomonas TaxID=1633643 RepID=A0A0P1NT95_9BACT|nr:phosphoribosylanthranilate isomerase [Candidatus Chrysopegis kryptomonas]CUT02208.1 phosphoribosylanthranilate isomerase [Candidatus Chrysopegis kryptomonas]